MGPGRRSELDSAVRRAANKPDLRPARLSVAAARPAHARIPGDLRGQPGRPGGRRRRRVPSTFCIPQGMPMMMNLYDPMEIIVTPEHHLHPDQPRQRFLSPHLHRRARLAGGDRADLSRATRSANGSTRTATAATTCSRSRPAASRARAPTTPAACRCTSTIRRSSRSAFHLDKADPNILHDEITVIDHALTRPWTVTKKAARNPNPASELAHGGLRRQHLGRASATRTIILSADGNLMPTKKDQAPPDLRYFKQPPK